jgi:cardiolipin synthase C
MLNFYKIFLLASLLYPIQSCKTPDSDETSTKSLAESSPVLSLMYDRTAINSNNMMILNTGDKSLLARLHMIRVAQRSIDIQTFIWKDDETGRLLLYELAQASLRGVRVRIIVDAMFGLKNAEMVASLTRSYPNIYIKYYNPTLKRINPNAIQTLFGGIINFRKINQRMHNKVMVFDNRAAIIGGRNIENKYYDRGPKTNFRDRDVLLIGKESMQVARSFEKFWNFKYSILSKNIREIKKELSKPTYRYYHNRESFNLGGLFPFVVKAASNNEVINRLLVTKLVKLTEIEFAADLPGKNESLGISGGGKLTKKFVETLQSARKSVLIQTPYLVLSHKAKAIFKSLAKRRIPVYISTNSLASTDNWMTYSAAFKNRRWNIETAKMNIFEYKPFPEDLKSLMPRYDTTRQYYKNTSTSEPRLLQDLFARKPGPGLNLGQDPFLCIHAKSFVIDNRLGVIGSYNLDPRSGNLNTEVAIFTTSPQIVSQLQKDILLDIQPRNSWTISPRKLPIGARIIDRTFGRILESLPLDLWILSSTSSYDIAGNLPLQPPGSPEFYRTYTDRGLFPLLNPLHKKEILTKLMKVIVQPISPIL